jgi:hypothetical protein
MDLPTHKAVQNYIGCNDQCPFCDSIDLDYFQPIERENIFIWQDVTCSNCGKSWRDEYSLVGISIRPHIYNKVQEIWYSDEAPTCKKQGETYYTHELKKEKKEANE